MHRAAACVLAAAAMILVPGAASAQILTAPPKYETAPDKLTAAEVKALFVGKHREDGVDISGIAWSIEAAADGSVTITAGAYFDSGKLVVRGNAVCVAWLKAWKGAEHCFHYVHHGLQLASYGPDGLLNSTLTISR
jgi:hypothetical protein